MLGPVGIATIRNIKWVLDRGHELILVGTCDPFAADNPYGIRKEAPANYSFIPFFGDRIEPNSNGYDITKSVENFTSWVRKWLGGIHIKWLVFRLKPDLIHVHAIYWVSECCATAKIQPLIVSAWGFLNHLIDDESTVGAKYICKVAHVLESANAVIVETPNLVDKTQALLKSDQKVALIPLGADTKRFCPSTSAKVTRLRQAFNIPQDVKVMLSPRSWSPRYGQLEIIKAYGLALANFKYPTAIVFLGLARGGVDQSFKAYFDGIVEEFKLQDRIHFLPRLPYDMMPCAYQLADIILNYPPSDAFPSTLMEVVACEKAVISSDLKAYKGTFIEQFATLVKPRNSLALASAMIEVVNCPVAEQIEAWQQARQVIVAQYEEKMQQQKLIEIYQKTSNEFSQYK